MRMMKKKLKLIGIKHCLLLSTLIIFAGCSTSPEKQDQIMSVQKRRIANLEKALDQKQKVITELKANRWANKPVKKSLKLALRPMIKQIKLKNWVKALKMSSDLKEKYPNSLILTKYRYSIFKKMGLDNQALQEKQRFDKLQAIRKKGSLIR